jgi:hypothetical protein
MIGSTACRGEGPELTLRAFINPPSLAGRSWPIGLEGADFCAATYTHPGTALPMPPWIGRLDLKYNSPLSSKNIHDSRSPWPFTRFASLRIFARFTPNEY